MKQTINMNAEEKIEFLKIELPSPPVAAGLYKPLVVVGDLAYFSGHLPIAGDGSIVAGKVGIDLSLEEGVDAARQVGLNVLATLRKELGSLNRVTQVVKILGMVNTGPGFTQHPQVINGCSELLLEIWGEGRGVGARSACGVSALPAGAAVEIEGILKIKA